MTKIRFTLLLMTFIYCSLNSQVPDETAGVIEVHNYLEMQLTHTISEQSNEFLKYTHPDAIKTGSYTASFYILEDTYEVKNVWKETLNRNVMIPHDEEFLAIELNITALGRIERGVFYEESEFNIIFYLSCSTGEFKILDTSKNRYFMMSLEDTIDWLEDRNEKRDYYKPAYNDLLAYLEEKDIPIPE